MDTRTIAIALSAAATLAACSPAGKKIECIAGWTMCGDRCRQLGSDEANCGACDNACSLSQSCIGGACVASCAKQLHAPTSDAWGFAWDGLERPAAIHSSARADCEAIGGRLPSLTELHRVSTPKTGAVGDATKTNAIWALTPSDASSHMAIALSNGATSVRADATAAPYRCVCPPPAPETFTGAACYGPSASECFSFSTEPALQFDSWDRPAATKSAAIWECTFAKGRLATAERLAAAVLANLPNGSNGWLHAADQMTSANGTLVKWSGPSWIANGNVTLAATTDLYPFRCSGRRSTSTVSASSVSGGVLAPATGVVSDGADRTASTFVAALDACFLDGGHLGTGSELASVAMQGLPRAATATSQLWTGDEADSGLAASFGWTGVARWPGGTGSTVEGLGFASPTSIDAAAKTSSLPSRCLYDPVDPGFAAPTSCNGTCTYYEVTAGRVGSSPAKIWIDGSDRTAATWSAAVSACSFAGGRLASARDLVEGIRNGLPGSASGTPENVLTADFAGRWVVVVPGYCRAWWGTICLWWVPPVYGWVPGIYAIPQWTGSANASYADGASVVLAPDAVARFRCVWTNEIR